MNGGSGTFPWGAYIAEFIGTAVLVGVGLSIVILGFGHGSPVIRWIPDAGGRRLLTGLLFGTTGALIALSPVGRHSGAHINPVVTAGFWLMGKMEGGHSVGYVAAQLSGALAGALPLLAWGGMGRSVDFGATLPGTHAGAAGALLGEMLCTFALVVSVFFMIRHRRLRAFTPALLPVLYAVMVYLEAPVSGTSTNPARSIAPEMMASVWRDWWVYWLGPFAGALMGVIIFRFTWLCRVEIEVAKLYHFEHDPHGVFQRL